MISLCIITGNEAAHIERMLASFAPAFDELSLVRAIGTATPDDTVERAREWCRANQRDFVFSDYRNGADLPHVDDFAAARNQSFAQATGVWLLWADCDDVCSDAAEIRTLVAEAQTKGDAMLRFPYSIPQSSKVTMRERLIRADLFHAGRKWHWPVHENLLIHAGDPFRDCPSPSWIHMPEGPKAGGEKRNLSILGAALRDAPTNYYYCHQEHFYLREVEKARRYGKLFLELPHGSPALRYQCLLNLCELSDSKDEAATYALKAHHLFPKHKEAIAALVRCSFQEDNAERAVHWSRLLMLTPAVPADRRLWCYEPKWDGWGKFDLRARALRLAGDDTGAANFEAAMRDHVPPRFSLLHATRGRVNRAIQARELWLEHADHPALVEHIFGVDADDADSLRWLRSFKRVISPQPTCVAAWNECAAASTGDILIQLSDDWVPPRGWDTALLRAIGNLDPLKESFVVAVSDGHRADQLLCMAIASRARWEQQGRELFSSEYESVFSDNEFTHRAYRDGVVIDARNLTFHHNHPAFGKGAMDDTYRRQNAPEKYQRGEATFRRRNPDAL